MTLRDKLGEGTDDDVAVYYLAQVLGIAPERAELDPGEWKSYSYDRRYYFLYGILSLLEDEGILESDGKPGKGWRWKEPG